MRIGFIATNLAGGGAEKAILNIAAALVARGHRSDIILLENIVAHAVPQEIGLRVSTASGRTISKGWLGKRLAARRLKRLYTALAREQPFDLLVSALPFGNEVTRIASLPKHWYRIDNNLSAEIARLELTNPSKAARRLARYRRLYDGRALIAVSHGVREDLRSNLGLHRARIEVISNPFDPEILRVQAAEPTNLPRIPYVIHVGRFSGQKRHDILLDAFSGMDERYRLVLLADPAPELASMIAVRGLSARVLMPGFQKNPYPWIAAAKLLVLSSDHEGLSNVIVEALMLGIPVVSTDCPSGPREILGESLREYLVPVGNAVELRVAMQRALKEPPDLSHVDLVRFAPSGVAADYERLAQEASE